MSYLCPQLSPFWSQWVGHCFFCRLTLRQIKTKWALYMCYIILLHSQRIQKIDYYRLYTSLIILEKKRILRALLSLRVHSASKDLKCKKKTDLRNFKLNNFNSPFAIKCIATTQLYSYYQVCHCCYWKHFPVVHSWN